MTAWRKQEISRNMYKLCFGGIACGYRIVNGVVRADRTAVMMKFTLSTFCLKATRLDLFELVIITHGPCKLSMLSSFWRLSLHQWMIADHKYVLAWVWTPL